VSTRALRPLVALAILALAAAGCVPTPEPTPSAPAFTSEAEAFAAAEETYRAYVDALNQVDLSDPETFEAVYAWTTGDANAGERTTFSQMHADGWLVKGTTAFDGFRPVSFTSDAPVSVVAELCLDVSGVDVFDRDGNSVVPAERLDRQPVVVTFLESGSTLTHLTIDASDAMDGHQCS